MEKFDNRKLAYMIMNSDDKITLAIKALAEACGDSPVVNGNTLSVELPNEYMQLVESTLNKEVDSVREEFRRISDRLKIVSGPRRVMSGPHIADEFKERMPVSSENGEPVNLCYNPVSILSRMEDIPDDIAEEESELYGLSVEEIKLCMRCRVKPDDLKIWRESLNVNDLTPGELNRIRPRYEYLISIGGSVHSMLKKVREELLRERESGKYCSKCGSVLLSTGKCPNINCMSNE